MSERVDFGGFEASQLRSMLNQTHFGPDLHGRNCGEIPDAHQIVGCAGEGEDPVHFADPTMPHFPQQRDRLQPAEAFFDPLPLLLAEAIGGVPRRPRINRAPAPPSVILRDVRRHVQMPALGHEPDRVKPFVSVSM